MRKYKVNYRGIGLAGVVGLLYVGILGACMSSDTPPATEANSTDQLQVSFTAPTDGATVTSPFSVTMAVTGMTLVPAGEVKAGEGHLHVMVDTPCIPAGEAIPKDETHLHYGQGQSEATLTLAPGKHTLCLQAADGVHIALADPGATQMITITVQ